MHTFDSMPKEERLKKYYRTKKYVNILSKIGDLPYLLRDAEMPQTHLEGDTLSVRQFTFTQRRGSKRLSVFLHPKRSLN